MDKPWFLDKEAGAAKCELWRGESGVILGVRPQTAIADLKSDHASWPSELWSTYTA